MNVNCLNIVPHHNRARAGLLLTLGLPTLPPTKAWNFTRPERCREALIKIIFINISYPTIANAVLCIFVCVCVCMFVLGMWFGVVGHPVIWPYPCNMSTSRTKLWTQPRRWCTENWTVNIRLAKQEVASRTKNESQCVLKPWRSILTVLGVHLNCFDRVRRHPLLPALRLRSGLMLISFRSAGFFSLHRCPHAPFFRLDRL